MTTATPRVLVGLMSGTSLDGISAAVVRFHAGENDEVRAELLAYRSIDYEDEQRTRLARAMRDGSPVEYCRLQFDLGEWLAQAAIAVIAEAGVPRADIAAIASHGQTIWHEPPHSTWQIGEAAVIAERTGIDVIADFRVRDVAAGGQGAPLVPIADAMLFSANHWRALQNLGGMGNVTVLAPGGDQRALRAFDTGPGVAVINGVTQRLTQRPFDLDGRLALAGTPASAVVDELLRDPYFAVEPPKSTGRELFSERYISSLIEKCARAGATRTEDVVATAVELTARSIADAYRRFVPEPITEVLLSGGGARNAALVRAITAAVEPLTVRRFDEVFFDGEAKESVAFALLGWLFLERRAGNVVTATGARGPRVLGKLTPAR